MWAPVYGVVGREWMCRDSIDVEAWRMGCQEKLGLDVTPGTKRRHPLLDKGGTSQSMHARKRRSGPMFQMHGKTKHDRGNDSQPHTHHMSDARDSSEMHRFDRDANRHTINSIFWSNCQSSLWKEGNHTAMRQGRHSPADRSRAKPFDTISIESTRGAFEWFAANKIARLNA